VAELGFPQPSRGGESSDRESKIGRESKIDRSSLTEKHLLASDRYGYHWRVNDSPISGESTKCLNMMEKSVLSIDRSKPRPVSDDIVVLSARICSVRIHCLCRPRCHDLLFVLMNTAECFTSAC
jgi:hypothetical protein